MPQDPLSFDLEDATPLGSHIEVRRIARVNNEPECWCGLDDAIASGATSFARYDIVCPKHDGLFPIRTPTEP